MKTKAKQGRAKQQSNKANIKIKDSLSGVLSLTHTHTHTHTLAHTEIFYYYCCNTFVCEQGKNYKNKFLKLVCRMRLRWRWRRLRLRLWRSPRHRHRVSHEFQNDVGSGAAVTNLAKLRQSPVERRESVQWATCGRAGYLWRWQGVERVQTAQSPQEFH